jgi:hypothetical protein
MILAAFHYRYSSAHLAVNLKNTGETENYTVYHKGEKKLFSDYAAARKYYNAVMDQAEKLEELLED